MRTRTRQAGPAFSLLELVIVVVVIGIIGAIAVPRISSASTRARATGFAASLRAFADGIERYFYDAGERWPADGVAGTAPPELQGYVDMRAWSSSPPMNGLWRNATGSDGAGAAMGVVAPTNEALAENGPQYRYADAILDDGRLSTGSMRILAPGKLYLVLEELPGTAVPKRVEGTLRLEEALGQAIDESKELIKR